MKSMKWWTANYKNYRKISVALLLVTFMIVATGCSIFPTEAEEEEIPVIEPPKISQKPEMKVTKGDMEITAKGTGQVYSNTEEYLYFTGADDDKDNPGQTQNFRIRKVYVEPGQQVEAGQILAELETKDLDLQIEQSANNLKIEEYQLIQILRQEPNTIEEQIQQEQVKAAFLEKKIAHEKLVRQMQNSQIIAPFDGYVYQVYYSDGDQVQAYDPVILLIDATDLVVGIRVTESDQKQLTIGQEVSVQVNRVNDSLKGTIVRMPTGKKNQNSDPWAPQKPADERNELVLIDVPNLPADVQRGQVANGTIVLQKKENVVKIPLSFLHTYGERNYVIVKDDQGKREVDVELGLRSAREVEIVAGIDAGVTIIGR